MELQSNLETFKKINHQTLQDLENCEPLFRKNLLNGFKKELPLYLENLRMNEERKSYFLHQVTSTIDATQLMELVGHINKLQMNTPGEVDLVTPVMNAGKPTWAIFTYSSNPIH